MLQLMMCGVACCLCRVGFGLLMVAITIFLGFDYDVGVFDGDRYGFCDIGIGYALDFFG